MRHIRYRHSVLAFGLLGTLILAETHGLAQEAATARSAATIAAPLEILASGHPVVEVSLDGSGAKRFVIDSAASTTTILPRLRAEMPGLDAQRADSPLTGASGAVDVELTRIASLAVAGHLFYGRELLLLPPGPVDNLGVDGILGADVIADYAIEMDMPGRTWRMAQTADNTMRAGFVASAPFALDAQRAPRLTIRINGITVPAILDTGARGTILNWAAARAIGIAPDDPGLVKASEVKGASSHGTASVKAMLRELMIGNESFAGREVRIADLSVFDALGYKKDDPAIILGIDCFADRRILIDYPARRLYLSAPAPRRGAAM